MGRGGEEQGMSWAGAMAAGEVGLGWVDPFNLQHGNGRFPCGEGGLGLLPEVRCWGTALRNYS